MFSFWPFRREFCLLFSEPAFFICNMLLWFSTGNTVQYFSLLESKISFLIIDVKWLFSPFSWCVSGFCFPLLTDIFPWVMTGGSQTHIAKWSVVSISQGWGWERLVLWDADYVMGLLSEWFTCIYVEAGAEGNQKGWDVRLLVHCLASWGLWAWLFCCPGCFGGMTQCGCTRWTLELGLFFCIYFKAIC